MSGKIEYIDEYGQGYDQFGRLVVCICGYRLEYDLDTGVLLTQHVCPYDDRPEMIE